MDRKAFAAFFLLVLTGLALAQAGRTVVEEGRLIIYFRNMEAGFEKYALYRQGDGRMIMETDSQLVLPRGAGNTFFTYQTKEVMDEKLNPLEYTDNFTVNDRPSNVYVSFSGGKATDNAIMGGQALTRTAKVSANFRILEEAVFSQYGLILRKYGNSREPNLPIRLYIPKIAQELAGKLSYSGEQKVTTPLGEMTLRRFFVDVGGFQGVSIGVNERNELMEMTITRQELRLVRDLAYDMKQAVPAAPAAPPAP
jgi:hypothetical protein